MNLDINSEMRVLWVASSGGHISELVLIADALESSSDSVWVTFDVPQTRSLLRGRNVHWVEYIAPRDLLAILRAGRSISGLLSHSNFDICVSTGSAIALSALPAARIRGVRSLYIESLARVAAPSVSGRLVSRIPGVECYSQHRSWTRARWSYSGSLLDSLNGCERQTDGSRPNLKVFVTLGTIRPFRFDGLVDAVKSLLEPGDSVVWQLGSTSRTDLPGRVYSEISIDQMRREIAECDVVVSRLFELERAMPGQRAGVSMT